MNKKQIMFNNSTKCKRYIKLNNKKCVLKNKLVFLENYFKKNFPDFEMVLIGKNETFSMDVGVLSTLQEITDLSGTDLVDEYHNSLYHLYEDTQTLMYSSLPNKVRKYIAYVNKRIPQITSTIPVGNIFLINTIYKKKTPPTLSLGCIYGGLDASGERLA